MGWCDQLGDTGVGVWALIDGWVRSIGQDPGPACMEQTYGGGHATNSWHHVDSGARARDYGSPVTDHLAIGRAAEELAQGPDSVFVELYCEELGIRWSNGSPSSYRDNPNHTHIALRPGAEDRLPQAPPAPPSPPPPDPDPLHTNGRLMVPIGAPAHG